MKILDDIIRSSVSETINAEELKHYGVKGMRWGVTRTPEQLANASDSNAKGDSKDASSKSGLPQAKDGVVTLPPTTGAGGSYDAAELEEMLKDLTDEEKAAYEKFLADRKKSGSKGPAMSLAEFMIQKRNGINRLSTDPKAPERYRADMRKLVKAGYTFGKKYETHDKSPGVMVPKEISNDPKALKASAEKAKKAKRNDEIKHYGTKGMRWGFRKATTRGSTPASKRKAKVDNGDKKEEPKKKSAKDLTDSELRDAINRVQLEKQYNQLTTPQKAESVVSSVLKTAGKQVATQVITQVGTAYLSKAVGVNLNKALPQAYRVTGKKG